MLKLSYLQKISFLTNNKTKVKTDVRKPGKIDNSFT
jgi:hypothetical protein